MVLCDMLKNSCPRHCSLSNFLSGQKYYMAKYDMEALFMISIFSFDYLCFTVLIHSDFNKLHWRPELQCI